MTRTALAIERFFSFIHCPSHTESRKPGLRRRKVDVDDSMPSGATVSGAAHDHVAAVTKCREGGIVVMGTHVTQLRPGIGGRIVVFG